MEEPIIVAEELAKKQREISIAEFFEKNRQILGFDSAPRSLLTCVKEAVDNALDACEEAGILPDILVQIERIDGDTYHITTEDNGPGIVKEQIPRTFAKLLYGSRFHALKQSRGQQGIGISAAVLYAQLTSGKPTRITSKIDLSKPAHYYELVVNTKTNEPEILVDDVVNWDRPHGTRIEMDLEGSYIRGRRRSVYEYLKATSIVNPHTRITLIEPDGNMETFERVSDRIPDASKEIKPHPSGTDLGILIRMLRDTDRNKISAFLEHGFVRIGKKTQDDICKHANIDPNMRPADFTRDQARRLLAAFKNVKIAAPPMDCLSPIGDDLIRKGLEKEYPVDYISTRSRKTSVQSGNPFLVEAGLAYGGTISTEDRVQILRFANRVPLIYQQGACAMTHAVEKVNWRHYGLNQPGGGIPMGPVVLLVHVASTNVPFTSESKDAVADRPEIISEVELALRDVARDLKNFLSRQKRFEKRKHKEEAIVQVLPMIAEKVGYILDKEAPDIRPVIANIMGNLLVQKSVKPNKNGSEITIRIKNFADAARVFKLHDISPDEPIEVNPKGVSVELESGYDNIWKLSLEPGKEKTLTYTIKSKLDPDTTTNPIVEGIDETLVTGATTMGGMT